MPAAKGQLFDRDRLDRLATPRSNARLSTPRWSEPERRAMVERKLVVDELCRCEAENSARETAYAYQVRKLQTDVAKSVDRAKKADAATNAARMESAKASADAVAESQRLRALVASLRAQIASHRKEQEAELAAAMPPPAQEAAADEGKPVAQLHKRLALLEVEKERLLGVANQAKAERAKLAKEMASAQAVHARTREKLSATERRLAEVTSAAEAERAEHAAEQQAMQEEVRQARLHEAHQRRILAAELQAVNDATRRDATPPEDKPPSSPSKESLDGLLAQIEQLQTHLLQKGDAADRLRAREAEGEAALAELRGLLEGEKERAEGAVAEGRRLAAELKAAQADVKRLEREVKVAREQAFEAAKVTLGRRASGEAVAAGGAEGRRGEAAAAEGDEGDVDALKRALERTRTQLKTLQVEKAREAKAQQVARSKIESMKTQLDALTSEKGAVAAELGMLQAAGQALLMKLQMRSAECASLQKQLSIRAVELVQGREEVQRARVAVELLTNELRQLETWCHVDAVTLGMRGSRGAWSTPRSARESRRDSNKSRGDLSERSRGTEKKKHSPDSIGLAEAHPNRPVGSLALDAHKGHSPAAADGGQPPKIAGQDSSALRVEEELIERSAHANARAQRAHDELHRLKVKHDEVKQAHDKLLVEVQRERMRVSQLRMANRTTASKMEVELRKQIANEHPQVLEMIEAEAEDAKEKAEREASEKRDALVRIKRLEEQLATVAEERVWLGDNVISLDEHAAQLRQALAQAHNEMEQREVEAARHASEVAALRRQLVGALAEAKEAKEGQLTSTVTTEERLMELKMQHKAELAARDAENQNLMQELEAARMMKVAVGPSRAPPRSMQPSSTKTRSPRSAAPQLSVSWTKGEG
ncbi:hypothetical protein AB1Y20_007979 [Prymnesium parvum]|uniref:Centrosomal protein of 162 kDa n=1 Tax=Prymnesium parvum TaxID=97485 RepID=A0AB34IVI8_PRYPA